MQSPKVEIIVNPNLLKTTFTYKDILLKKLYGAVVSSVCFQLVILNLYLFTVNFDIFNPLMCLRNTFYTLLSFNTWIFLLPFVTLIFAQCVICAKDYIFSASYSSTRFGKFLSVFSFHNLVLLLLNLFIGSLQIWLFRSIKSDILNEDKLLLNLGSIWISFYYFIRISVGEKHLTFPVIHQRKLMLFKANCIPLVRQSLFASLWPSIIFLTLYYYWGADLLRTQLIFLFGQITVESELNYWTCFYYLVFSTLYFFNMGLIHLFFFIFLTEPIEFPLSKFNQNILTLQEAMNMNNFPIIQNLACQDFYLLTKWSPQRRLAFYTLSQPGGHPLNWNSLVEAILKLFRDYTSLLEKSIENVLVNEKITQTVTTSDPNVHCQVPPVDRFRSLRNMTFNHSEPVDIVNINYNNLQELNEISSTFLNQIKIKLHNIINILKTIFGINYLFGEIPQANIQKCLANGRLIMWTSQGIAELAISSLQEDVYGVVQKDIPVIITSLVNLKQSLDKLNKVPALTRRQQGSNNFNCNMKNAVSLAVRRSLFQICFHFSPFLNDLPLSKEVFLYLQNYIMFK